MLPLPEGIIAVLGYFASLFSQPVWRHVWVLVVGALLCQGARTVTAVLRVMGLKGEKHKGQVSSCPQPRALVGLGWRTDTARTAGGAPACRMAGTGRH
jgi:hypothetical protein